MEKTRNSKRLVLLYLSYHMNKTSLIVFGIMIFILGVVFILNTGIPFKMENYLVCSNAYHVNYLEQSMFFLEILNGVLVSFIVGAEISSFSLFDPMFVPNTSRIRIILCKIVANLILLCTLLVFQIILLFLIGIVIFPKFKIELVDFSLIFYFALPMIELLLLGEFFSLLVNSYFIPILIFILHILFIVLMNISSINKILYLFLPKIMLSDTKFILKGNLFIYSGICIMLGIGIALLFQKKDI